MRIGMVHLRSMLRLSETPKNRTRPVATVLANANLCTEAHMRELAEQGFEIAVVKDGTAAAIVPEGNGYEAALVNFRFIANAVWTTEEVKQEVEKRLVK